MTRRRLAPDEIDLWRKVADRTTPLDLRQTFDVEAFQTPTPEVSKPKKTASRPVFPPKPAARKSTHDLMPSLPERMRNSTVQMDQKAFGKLKRGKLSPEGRIDLHGMTLDRAHPALTRFILSSHGANRRLVLVITGKGKQRDEGGPIPIRHGVLRHQVPQWLSMPPLKSVVLQVAQAHISHGGGGAYYVYLRRQR
ncbi:MAG: Smr/MutS family protein [Sulfitobacter sp.]